MSAGVSAVAARALLAAAESLGLDGDELLAAAGLTRAELADSDARVDRMRSHDLWRAAFERSGDPRLALHAAEALPPAAYKVVDFIIANSPTVGDALQRLAVYFPIIDPAVVLEVVEEGDEVCYRMTAPGLPAALPASAVDYTLAAILLGTRRAVAGGVLPLVRVDVPYPAPADPSEHRRLFAAPVRFAAAHAQLVMTASTWRAPMAAPDHALLAVLEAHARSLLDEVDPRDDLVAQVRRRLSVELRGGEPTLPRVAAQLSVGERTLQRRLADRGVRFADLVDGERQTMAKLYLRDPDLAVAEIAFLLGFSEQSAFTRAFRRWTGTTPARWRKQPA